MTLPPLNTKDQDLEKESPRTEVWGDSSFVDTNQQADFYRRFGQRLKDAREKANITQETLAGWAGINRSYLSQIECGRRRVSLYLACRLASALDRTLDILME